MAALGQAARVFVYDLLMTGRDGSTSILPSLAAALDAWPEAIPALPPATGGGGGIEGTERATVAALHTVLGKLCHDALVQTRYAARMAKDSSNHKALCIGASALAANCSTHLHSIAELQLNMHLCVVCYMSL